METCSSSQLMQSLTNPTSSASLKTKRVVRRSRAGVVGWVSNRSPSPPMKTRQTRPPALTSCPSDSGYSTPSRSRMGPRPLHDQHFGRVRAWQRQDRPAARMAPSSLRAWRMGARTSAMRKGGAPPRSMRERLPQAPPGTYVDTLSVYVGAVLAAEVADVQSTDRNN